MDTFRDELVHWLSAPPWTLVSRGLINQCWEGVTLEYLGCFTLTLGAASETAADAKVETACAAILESILKT